jgi:hypothetical protein
MKRGILILAMLMTGAAVWCPPLQAARTPIDESAPADPDGVVTIENLIGSVTVEGWNKNQVSVTGMLGEGPEELEFDADGDETTITVVWPDRKIHTEGRNAATDLEVKVPEGSEVRVEGVNLTIDVSGVTGEVSLEAVNGSISVDGSPEELGVETVNGSIEISVSSEAVEAETVNGDVIITADAEEISASTVNGSIEISGGTLKEGRFGSVSGDIEFRGDLARQGSLEIETHSGSVTLVLPRDVSAEFEVETFSGKIVNDLGPKARKVSKYAPGWELEFVTGSGEAQVEISSFSGKVEIRKK